MEAKPNHILSEMKRKLEDNEVEDEGEGEEELMLDAETIGRLLESAPEVLFKKKKKLKNLFS